MARGGAFRERQVVNAPTPRARIDTRDQSREEQAQYYQAGGGAPKPRKGSAFEDAERPEPERFKATPESLKRLEMFATTRGNIMHLLNSGAVWADRGRRHPRMAAGSDLSAKLAGPGGGRASPGLPGGGGRG